MFCRGQSSVEYLFVVALSLMLIIPASMLFFSYSKSSEDSVVAAQVNRVGNEVMVKVEEMYVFGKNSWITLKATLPDSFENATIYGSGSTSELVISYYTQTGLTDAVFFSDILLTDGVGCTNNCVLPLNPGVNNIRITSRGENVSITNS